MRSRLSRRAFVGYSQGAHSAVALWLASAARTHGTQKIAIREVYVWRRAAQPVRDVPRCP